MKEVCLPGCSRMWSECCHNWLNNGKRDGNDSKIWMRSSILYNIIYRSEAPVYAFLIYCKQWTLSYLKDHKSILNFAEKPFD